MTRTDLDALEMLCERVQICDEFGPGLDQHDELRSEWQAAITPGTVLELVALARRIVVYREHQAK